jgi:superfamily I DNA/RNA helicase
MLSLPKTFSSSRKMFSVKMKKEKKIYRSLSDADEANFVAGNIWETRNREQRKYSDFAILYVPTLRPVLLKMR